MVLFVCSMCGACCRRVGLIINELVKKGFPYKVKENGSCEMLDENNLCKVYDNRPDMCSIEKTALKSGKTKEEYYKQTIEMCNEFIRQDQLNKI